jgi:hypothetical protein
MGGSGHPKPIFFSVSSLIAKKQVARKGQPWQEASKRAAATRTTRAADRVVVRLEVEVVLIEGGDIASRVKVQ